MPRILSAFKQFFDGEGNPLVDGWLKFTESGTNNTDKDTFADADESIPNTNPLQLDGEGRCPDVFGTGSYRVVSFTNDEVLNQPAVQIQQKDPVPGGSETAGNWADWFSTGTYPKGRIVIADDGKYYRSLVNNNRGNDPSGGASPTQWEEVLLLSVFNVNKAYVTPELIIWTDNNIYECVVDTVAGDTPKSAPAKWNFVNGSDKKNDLGDTGGGTVDIDWSLGDYVLLTISTSATTLTFSNWASLTPKGGSKVGILELTNAGSQTLNFPAGTEWPGGSPEEGFTESGKDLITVVSSDEGSTIMVFVAGLDIKAAV